ncbi:MAG: hypothetical protein A3J83_04965 [Elusimicrobia bacterium RIFOXYA2_FULL_40_6]|nr:MAG: hypothetical protein A3J83_04965 [Elusimicrobia bacterium RIFOXYA2_FULL_40_6]
MINLLMLLGMGFGIGLSGALMPGPLLAFTIKESIKYGAKTGFLVIIGHFIVELLLVLLIVGGIFSFLSSPFVAGIIGIVGSVFLFFSVIDLMKQKAFSVVEIKDRAYGPILGGLVFTLFNPSFAPWWSSVGYSMIWNSLKLGGTAGVVVVLIGHWFSDFGWYMFVSAAVAKGKDVIVREKVFPVVKVIMSLFMFFIGVFFLVRGLKVLLG